MTADFHWEPYQPQALAGVLRDLPGPWWVAGGWALELFAGRRIRDHGDLDIEIPRHAVEDLASLLRGWDIRLAQGGTLVPWRSGERIPPRANSFWCRPDPSEPWRFQTMLGLMTADRWFYRRDHRIWRELSEIGVETDSGLPVLAPEIQLLYKSNNTRPRDRIDFDAVVDLLDDRQRGWLLDALTLTAPDHSWTDELRRSRDAS